MTTALCILPVGGMTRGCLLHTRPWYLLSRYGVPGLLVVLAQQPHAWVHGAAGVHRGGIPSCLDWRWGCCELLLGQQPRCRLICKGSPPPQKL